MQKNQRYHGSELSNLTNVSASSSKSQLSSSNSRSSKKVIITEKIPGQSKILLDNSSQTSFESNSDSDDNIE